MFPHRHGHVQCRKSTRRGEGWPICEWQQKMGQAANLAGDTVTGSTTGIVKNRW